MKLQKVSPIRDGRILFRPIDLELVPGSVSAVMGPSGIGKSSLLESISGNLDHTGTISTRGSCFSIYQEIDQLFPWMSIHNNLKICNPTADWKCILSNWNLSNLLDKSPESCSIGQQQRIILLRAIHSDRSVLLCDEPLSGVDEKTTDEILDFFLTVIQHSSKKVLWVTHNRSEAQRLGNITEITPC
jgi:ABC-type nitrate/sulfonate/bicarbonate transport system ATPase subunit